MRFHICLAQSENLVHNCDKLFIPLHPVLYGALFTSSLRNEGRIALELLTSVVVQRRVASLARTRRSGRSVVVVGVLLLLLVLVIVGKLLVLIVHVTPVTVERALLPGDKVNGQAVGPDILHFADRFCRGRHLKKRKFTSCSLAQFSARSHSE